MENPFRFDTSFVVSVTGIRQLLDQLCTENTRWWIESIERDHVCLACNNSETPQDPFNHLLFQFPIIATVPFVDEPDNKMVALYPLCANQVQRGLYIEYGQIKTDETGDWEKFWVPIEAALKEKLKDKADDQNQPAITTQTSGAEEA